MHGSSFVQTWIIFTKECFVSSLVERDFVVPEKKIFKNGKCINFHHYLPLEKGVALYLNKL